jgi:hypothetical protein
MSNNKVCSKANCKNLVERGTMCREHIVKYKADRVNRLKKLNLNLLQNLTRVKTPEHTIPDNRVQSRFR